MMTILPYTINYKIIYQKYVNFRAMKIKCVIEGTSISQGANNR